MAPTAVAPKRVAPMAKPALLAKAPAKKDATPSSKRAASNRVSVRRAKPDRSAAVVELLKSARTRAQQRTLILRIRMRRDPSTLDALLRHLQSTESVHDRQLASLALGAAGAWWALEPIREQLRDPSRSVKTAARRALRKLCPRARWRSRFELVFEPPTPARPSSLQARRAFLLHLFTALSHRQDAVIRWPGCAPARGRRLSRFRVRPFLKLEQKGGRYHLSASVMLVRMPKRSVVCYAQAKATFKATLDARTLRRVLSALTASLQRQLQQYFAHRLARL